MPNVPLKKKKVGKWKIGISITIIILGIIGFAIVRNNSIKSSTVVTSKSQTEKTNENFTEELARVTAGGQWGYINKKGDFGIQPQFENAYDFYEGIAAVKIGGKWGYINKEGKVIIQPNFGEVGNIN